MMIYMSKNKIVEILKQLINKSTINKAPYRNNSFSQIRVISAQARSSHRVPSKMCLAIVNKIIEWSCEFFGGKGRYIRCPQD